MRSPLRACGIAGLLLAAARSGDAHAACYRWPFDHPVFGDAWHATEGRDHPHYGLDFPMASGTTVLAISNATVVKNGWSNCLGWYLVLEHPDGWYSGYGHLLAQSSLGVGAAVTIGDGIARVGNTGSCSRGAHLHMTVGDHAESYGDGRTVDPYAFIAGRGPTAEVCDDEDDDCDGGVDEDEVCERDVLRHESAAYAPPTTTDLDGDGKVDLCALEADGVRCRRSLGTGWDAPWDAIPWSRDEGWSDPAHAGTLRMGDLDGDGRADVCARAGDAIACARSTGSGFEAPTVWRSGFGDEAGWADPSRYSTLRLADVTGDGRDDLCARDADGLRCWASDGQAFVTGIAGPAWSDAAGYGVASHYGTLRMADLDGDHRADACIRGPDGVECWRSDGTALATRVVGPAWRDASGWGHVRYWSTFRLADVDGDGRVDACARSSQDYRCAPFLGETFGDPVVVAALADASGWGDGANYATLRAGDIDGDGADDICARANALALCWAWDGAAFTRHDGPAWADDSGWGAARYYQTMRLADVDGDGRADLCARASAGWRCHPSDGVTFGAPVLTDALSDGAGADDPAVWSSILSGGRSCGVTGSTPCPDVGVDGPTLPDTYKAPGPFGCTTTPGAVRGALVVTAALLARRRRRG
jgi:hypothetical protein